MATFTQIYSTRVRHQSSLISSKDMSNNGSVLQYSPRRSTRGPVEAFPEDEEAKSFRKWSGGGQKLLSRQGVKKEVPLHDFSQTQMTTSGDELVSLPFHASASPRYKIELSEKEFVTCSTPIGRHPSDLFADRHLMDVIESGSGRTASAEFAQIGNLPTPPTAVGPAIISLERKPRTKFENVKEHIDEVPNRKASVENKHTEIQHPLMNVAITGKDEKLSMEFSNSIGILRRDLEMLVDEEEKQNVALNSNEFTSEKADAEPKVIDHVGLQKEIKQLKNKLNEEELQHLYSDDKALTETDQSPKLSSGREMQAKIDALQQELLRKERLSQSEQYHLSQKQNEIAELRSMLQSIHEDIVQKNEETANMGEEIDKLRRQVAALRQQLGDDFDLSTNRNEELSLHNIKAAGAQSVTDESSTFSNNDLQMFKKEIMETEGSWLSVNEQMAITKMDASRRMYLAAVLTAREKPGAESLALATEFRKQLQHLLSQPEFAAPVDDTLASQDMILQMF